MDEERPLPSIGQDLRALFDAAPDAVLAVDEDGRIAYVNARVTTAFGYTVEELLGRPVERLLPERFAETHQRHRTGYLAQAQARPMGSGLALWGRHRDGHECPVEISLAPLVKDGRTLVFATVVDIGPRKALERQLIQSQKLEIAGRLLNGVAHDYNNVQFAILGMAQLLEQDLQDLPALVAGSPGGRAAPAVMRAIDELLGYTHTILDASTRATALTGRLLAFARPGSIIREHVAIADAVAALVPVLEIVVGESIHLRLDLDPATGQAEIDKTQFDQVLMNLVVNARDAMPGGGDITIETRDVTFDTGYALEYFEVEAGAYVMIAVSDTGTGMDTETKRHVWEPFFTTKQPGQGTGLGLSTVMGIVKEWRGHVWLYSEPGNGTTFKVYVPRAGAVQEPVAEDEAPPPVVEARSRILLVDDDDLARTTVRRILEKAGWTVMALSEPTEALQLIESRGVVFDALVTDVRMPQIEGDVLAARTMELRPGTGVVILSGHNEQMTQVQGLVERGARFASKPIPTRELVELVREAIGEARSRVAADA